MFLPPRTVPTEFHGNTDTRPDGVRRRRLILSHGFSAGSFMESATVLLYAAPPLVGGTSR